MDDNNEASSIDKESDKEHYSDVSDTGALSSIILTVVITIAMYILAKLMGN